MRADPANVIKLQNAFYKCLSKNTAAILALFAPYISDNNSEDSDTNNQSTTRGDLTFLIPMLGYQLNEQLKHCIREHLNTAYVSGQYNALKQLSLDKSKLDVKKATTSQEDQNRSMILIKAALVKLTANIFTARSLGNGDQSSFRESLDLTFNRIANTETLRQKVLGAVNVFRDQRISDVIVKAEYRTAGDNRVCPKCAAYEGRVLQVDELASLIPQHPNCRCWFRVEEDERSRD
jgi:SPP1 gp7 family putative phage head morphogenesis protein